MIELKTTDHPERIEERVPLFSIDGVEYTMAAAIKPNVGLKYLWMLKTDGQEMAAAWLIEQVLGAEGFKALANHEDLEISDFQKISFIIREHALGSMEGEGKAPASSSRDAQRKSSG